MPLATPTHRLTPLNAANSCSNAATSGPPTKPVVEAELTELYRSYYAGQPFVRVRAGLPATKETTGTNFLDVAVKVVRGGKVVVVLAAEDNLVRGASGVAVQNFNRMFGFDERTGLL